ncbi:hypothetical protein BDQ17DRAFT_716101 [Cyathus striatus]|nr:hypothetical protein BDQ17DRAFT_716101 [Cyathus striatus]
MQKIWYHILPISRHPGYVSNEYFGGLYYSRRRRARRKRKEVVQTDVFEKEDFTITRTIIRPKPSRSVLSIFSRPSSPLDPTSRPGTPLGINFKALNCITASHAFEEEVDYLQLEREREHELHIRVFQEQSVHNESHGEVPFSGSFTGSTLSQPMLGVSRLIET